MTPSYIKLHEKGELEKRARALVDLMNECVLCPRRCGARRLEGETGTCETGRLPVMSSAFAHFGEESPLVGRRGSGTIFFTHCNLLCSFCQNYDISHMGEGREVSIDQLAAAMISLQERGCHNINFVTPTHVTARIVEALPAAVDRGLKVPLVYNCGGYESVETLRLLDGVIDIYMPDFKFWDAAAGRRFTGVPDYPEVARQALKEMHRQAGDLVLDDEGIAQRGILLRHLVLPANLAGTRDVMRFVAREISPGTYVNVMPQYHPCGEAAGERDMARRITGKEFKEAVEAALEEGITRLDERRISLLLL
jgi:putative pyruvate formate lyase activating enzyme